MLETFRTHSKGWLAKLILALITVPFALWGIDSYLQGAGSNVAIAKVDGQSVTAQEFGNALQNLRNQMQAGGQNDPALLEDPALKLGLVNRLIDTRLLSKQVSEAKFAIGNDQLAKFIMGLPEFQKDGQFSQERYDSLLQQNQLSPAQFDARMRNELLVQQARGGIGAAAFMSPARVHALAAVLRQQREVSLADIKAAQYLDQVSVSDTEVKAYFDKHKERFMVPEQVKIEFVTLSANSLITGVQVSDEEIKKFYDENAAKFQGDEQRRASHILIGLGKGDAAAKQAAREQASRILEEVKRSPKQFAELAKKYSQDPGSGQNGGDLGLFGRGAMVKPFEDAVFSMKPGAISDLVESEFGYHIIQLTGIQGSASSLDKVKTEIRAELMYQKALAKFAEQAENFSNMVYEQSGSLDPVVKAFGTPAQNSPLMSRDELMKFFKSEKLVNAIFSDEVLKEKRNSEAIEAAPNTLVSARVLEYKPAAPRSFDEVAPALQDFLKSEKAFALAVKQGGDMLARLKQGQDVSGLEWIPPVTVDRKNAQGLTDDIMTLAFKMDTGKLPAYAGLEKPGAGYTLVRVTKLNSPALEDDAEKKMVSTEVDSALAEEYEAAYLASLRSKAKITVNEALLNSGSQP